MNENKKIINSDNNKKEIKAIVRINSENDITLGLSQDNSSAILNLSYNQLCEIRRVINQSISNHYNEYESSMEKEKTQKIFIDDPIAW